MRQHLTFVAITSVSFLAAACAEPTDDAVGSSRAELNIFNDLAPECQGIIDYANTASFETLDEYLPSNVAQNIVSARAASPFVTMASLSAVSGIAQTRLEQIAAHARADDFIDEQCEGVYEEVAISATEAANLISYVNAVSEAELDAVIDFQIDEGAADALLAGRPYSAVAQIDDTYRVGPDTFRALRNASFQGPWDALIAAANAASGEVELRRHFEFYDVLDPYAYRLNGMTCFGVPTGLPSWVPTEDRMADADEVMDEVVYAVGSLPIDSTAGLADLAERIEGGSFYGCYISYSPNPWCGLTRRFFVNPDTGFSVFVESGWCE